MSAISVILASYNGELYIREQIDSILSQLRQCDELIITDDGSNDNTINVVQSYVDRDPRVTLIAGPQRGVIANFEFGIKHATNDIICLSDQDDVWKQNKVETICKLFAEDPRTTCVLHDVYIVDKNLRASGPSFFSLRGSKLGLINNLFKNSYMGSAMAFRKTMLKYILPIPSNVPMHDQWIGLVNEIYGHSVMCYEKLGLYRRHEDNVSSFVHGSIPHMISSRFFLILNLIKIRMNYR